MDVSPKIPCNYHQTKPPSCLAWARVAPSITPPGFHHGCQNERPTVGRGSTRPTNCIASMAQAGGETNTQLVSPLDPIANKKNIPAGNCIVTISVVFFLKIRPLFES